MRSVFVKNKNLMRKFQVVLNKSYLVTVNAVNEELAKRYCEYYTSDIKDITTDKENDNFTIEEIECTINEVYETKEVI